jgi:hypothetical protein
MRPIGPTLVYFFHTEIGRLEAQEALIQPSIADRKGEQTAIA